MIITFLSQEKINEEIFMHRKRHINGEILYMHRKRDIKPSSKHDMETWFRLHNDPHIFGVNSSELGGVTCTLF